MSLKPANYGKDNGLLGYATDEECIFALLRRIGHLEMVIREAFGSLPEDPDDAYRVLRHSKVPGIME
jgi:hypothetical protein